jgi:hypothetical protein
MDGGNMQRIMREMNAAGPSIGHSGRKQ